MNENNIEQVTQKIGREIFENLHREEPHFWEAQWWERQTIEWLMNDAETKSRILRFIDVFPALRSDKAVAKHLGEYLPKKTDRLPRGLLVGKAVIESALYTPKAVAAATSLATRKIAERFIAGSTLEETGEAIKTIMARGLGYTLDLLGEATLSDKEADTYASEYIELIKHLAASHSDGDQRVNVSLKLSSLTPRFDPSSPEEACSEVMRRIKPIIKTAMEANAEVNIDMEHFDIRDLTLKVFYTLLKDKELKGWDGLGIVSQAYLADARESLEETLGLIEESGQHVTVRLVKGAYWDREVVVSNQRGWPVPVHTVKANTDVEYENLSRMLIERPDIVTSAIASHNIRSIAKAIAISRELGAPEQRFEVQMLYGMGDPIKKALVDMGIRVREYAPFGETIPGMAYLVRRMLENSSNESFLRRSFVEEAPPDIMLEDPAVKAKNGGAAAERKKEDAKIFVNEPEPMFHKTQTRLAIDEAIERAPKTFGQRYNLLIDGNRIDTKELFASTNPSAPSQLIGEICKAGKADANKAIDSAAKAFGHWAGLGAPKRREILSRAAEIIRTRKFELAALQMFEVGKTRREAIGDVDEAIDHIEFYSRVGVDLAEKKETQKLLGETNQGTYRPRGAGAIISPWNFPLAILAGMTAGALSAGNTVVIKPASSAAVTAAIFVDILIEAGIPPGAVNFLPGPGEEIGQALVENRKTSFVMFTGSWPVGASIMERAAMNQSQRNGFTKVITEMGGKNAIIIDESADLDEAVAGVVTSAFGFGGQKCSACSRVIVLKEVYDSFIARLVPAVESLIVDSPLFPQTSFGPLVDFVAKRKSESYIAIGKEEATTLFIGEVNMHEGHFVGPAIFGDVDPQSAIATEEIFGPILSVIRATSVSHAINIANSAIYALTCGIYSRTPSSAQKFINRVEAGNVYVNRKITGAIVGRQPFGGFKRSGPGSAKAGSPELVKELMVPQSITENIVRHGFSPDLDS